MPQWAPIPSEFPQPFDANVDQAIDPHDDDRNNEYSKHRHNLLETARRAKVLR